MDNLMSSSPRKKKTFIPVLASVGLLFACAAVGYYFYTILAADKELQEAVAEADRLDPGWRLEVLEANREVIPDTENSALKVLAVKKLIPTSWPSPLRTVNKDRLENSVPVSTSEMSPTVEEKLADLSPEVQLNDEVYQELRAELQKVAPALAEARSLVNFPQGRYRVNWALDYITTPLPCQDARPVFNLLRLDAQLRAQEGDIGGAIVSDLAILNAGRSIGNEPCLISQLVRLAGENVAIGTLERILAQGQASEECLRNLQSNLEDEALKPLFLYGARGERAGNHRMIEAIEAGKLKPSSFASLLGGTPPTGVEAWWEDFAGEWQFRRTHAPCIRVMTELIEIAKLPAEQQRSKLKSYSESTIANGRLPLFVRLVLPSITRAAESFIRNQSWLRCAVVAVAVERYRLAHNRWPDSLDQLVPKFLDQVPFDPYDGKPMRYRRVEEGVVIYSIGPDEKDDGGRLNRQKPAAPGSDLGFQLWDVNRRRQPWRLPPKAAEDDNN
jgi:hypothetical protein